METTRTEAFSDGVFAIAATLLVIEIHPPDPAGADLLADLLAEWPAYAAYAVSFLTIGIVWVNHHGILNRLARVDRNLLFLNLLLLLLVGFVPFPTAFLADALRAGEGERVAAVTYGLVMAAMGAAFSLLWTYAASRSSHLLAPGAESVRANVARSWLGPPAYLAAAGLAALAPTIALALYALVALYFAHPGLKRRP